MGLLFFSALALGPACHVAGQSVAPRASVLMPYRLIQALPFGDIPRVPARFVVMSTLCLSVIASCGAWVILRQRSRPTALGVALVLAGLSVIETTAVPIPMAAVAVPSFYARLAREPVRAGVLEVPIPDDPAAYPLRMMYQTHHGKPLYGGHISRGFPALRFEAVPGFSQFKTLSKSIDDIVPYDRDELPTLSRAVLNVYGAGYIVVEKGRLGPDRVERARDVADAVLGSSTPLYEDAATLAFSVPPPTASPLTAIWLDTGWSYLEHLQEQDTTTGRPLRWRWMENHARLGVVAPASLGIRLRLSTYAFGRTRRLKLAISGSEIATLRVSTQRAGYETPIFVVPAGTSFIDLESLDGSEPPGTEDPTSVERRDHTDRNRLRQIARQVARARTPGQTLTGTSN